MEETVFFATPAEFRIWLTQHHATASELWVGLYKKHSGWPSITWPEAVDEALCLGWIDGRRKNIDAERYRTAKAARRALRRAVRVSHGQHVQRGGTETCR